MCTISSLCMRISVELFVRVCGSFVHARILVVVFSHVFSRLLYLLISHTYTYICCSSSMHYRINVVFTGNTICNTDENVVTN